MLKNVRNFSIIAHINHGKSTLADRFIEICGGLSSREMCDQVLDSMDIERERGITIKSQCVNLKYNYNSIVYKLNIIDTPGHVDFSYEVSRSIFACEGVILLVDASQGIEAQTVSNYQIALKCGLKILPVINKIDLQNANVEKTINNIINLFNYDFDDIIKISSKKNIGVDYLLQKIIDIMPHPNDIIEDVLKCLIIDSWFNSYIGVVVLIRVKQGIIKINDKIVVISTKNTYIVSDLGYFGPKKIKRKMLIAGEVGYIAFGIKDVKAFPVGDTLTLQDFNLELPLSGFQKIIPKVYVGIYCLNNDCSKLKDALAKLQLNDSSLVYENEFSDALGYGFRCGFLGLLHLDIIKDRIYREYGLEILITNPTVIFKIIDKNNSIMYIDRVSVIPKSNLISKILEPIAKVNIIVSQQYIGVVIKLCVERRGYEIEKIYFDEYVSLEYHIPMIEIIYDFFDVLKSITHGFSSFEYKFLDFKESDLVKVDILINKILIDELSFIVHKKNAYFKSCTFIDKIKNTFSRKMYDVSIQAAINSKIISKAVVKAFRKDVTSKCYGGDITRKKKLLKKQKLGKKKMKNMSNKINIKSKEFLSIFSIK